MGCAWIDAGGVALRYELSGPEGAPVVVLLHEMGGTLESWDLVVPSLQQEYRVLRFDMRGFGLSEKIRGGVDGAALAGDVRALLDGLRLQAPVALVGCAVGAAVALGFAGAHPDRTAMALVSSPSTGIAPEKRVATLATIERFEREGLRAIERSSLEASYPPALRAADQARFEATRQRWLGNDTRSFAAVYRMLVKGNVAGDLARIARPTLVLGCSLDAVRPPPMASAVAKQIPHARFEILESGHLLPLQHPDLLLGALLPFLGKHRDRFH